MLHFCYHCIFFLGIFLLSGCSSSEDLEPHPLRRLNQKGEYIYRKHNEFLFTAYAPEKQSLPAYPWDKAHSGQYPKITKEFFRCKGSQLNPCRIVQGPNELDRYHDCGGAEAHSLPLRDGKEFIYPILIDLVNYIQNKTGKRVVITSGHRCPVHHLYVDPSPEYQCSKHMIGAEATFYVQGMEEKPEIIIKMLQDFYKENARYKGQKDYEEFKPYEKESRDTSAMPIFNKEIFIKLYKKKEGRNFDNRHSYPYISIQVRFDRDLNEKVVYSWEKANRNYHRY